MRVSEHPRTPLRRTVYFAQKDLRIESRPIKITPCMPKNGRNGSFKHVFRATVHLCTSYRRAPAMGGSPRTLPSANAPDYGDSVRNAHDPKSTSLKHRVGCPFKTS